MAALAAAPLAILAGVTVPGWVLGFIALLLLFGFSFLFRKPLVAILGSVPAIGGAIAGAVDGAIGQVGAWIGSWISGYVVPLISTLMRPIQLMVMLPGIILGAIEYTMGQVRITADAAAGAVGHLGSDLSGAMTNIGTLFVRLASAVAGLAAANVAIGVLRSTTIPAARSEAVAQAGAHADARVESETTARAKAVAQEAAARASAVAAEATTRARADEAGAAKAAAAAAALASALASLSVHVRTETDARVGDLEDALADVRTRAIPQEAARAKAAEAVLTDELAAATAITSCLASLCSSGYANLVGQLLQGAELLALLELVGAAIRDPRGTASSTAGSAGSLIGGASSLLSPVLGVQL